MSNTKVVDIPNITDCGCPDETQKPLNESDASRDSCGDLATYPEPCPKGLMDLYCTKFTGSADVVFGVAPGDRGSTVLVKIMNKIKELHGLGVPSTLPLVNNIIVSNITSTTINLSWLAVVGATKYDLRYRKVIGQPDWQYINNIPVTNIQLTNLLPNTNYYYQIMARDAASAYSEWTTQATFKTLVQLSQMTTPVGLVSTPSTVMANQFTASWDPVPGATSYEVRVRVSGVSDILSIIPVLTNSAVILVSNAGVYYEWQVIAKGNGLLDSELSAISGTAVKGEPPKNLAVSSITAISAMLTWEAPYSNAPLRFELRLQSGVGGTLEAKSVSSDAVTSWAISGLTPNTVYEIRGYNQTSPQSDIVYKSFVTLP